MSTTSGTAEPRLRWWVAAVLLIVINLVLFAYRVGECTDYALGSGIESTCTSSPVLGIPGTWVLGVLSLIAVAYCLYRALRRPTSRNGTVG